MLAPMPTGRGAGIVSWPPLDALFFSTTTERALSLCHGKSRYPSCSVVPWLFVVASRRVWFLTLESGCVRTIRCPGRCST